MKFSALLAPKRRHLGQFLRNFSYKRIIKNFKLYQFLAADNELHPSNLHYDTPVMALVKWSIFKYRIIYKLIRITKATNELFMKQIIQTLIYKK